MIQFDAHPCGLIGKHGGCPSPEYPSDGNALYKDSRSQIDSPALAHPHFRFHRLQKV